MLLAGLVAFLMAAVLTPLLAAWARRRNLLDIPNERSSHQVATPRIGGAAFALSLLAALWLAHVGAHSVSPSAWLVVAAACGLALVGLIDDFRPLPALLRLVIQVGISILVAANATPPAFVPTAVSIAVIALWTTAATNAFNFMDGIDGIGGGQAIAAGVGWLLVGRLIGSDDVALLGLLGAAAPAGFLLYNWAPAKVFMGDVGSAFLGFLFAALPAVAGQASLELWVCAVLLLWPFLFDTALTLTQRSYRRENILAAHRSHLYQRLTASGLSHARVAVLYTVLAFTGVIAAVVVVSESPGAPVIAVVIVGCSALSLWRYVSTRSRNP
jgi:UDP-N-acetylmuramyl pentapeptide phosphotransferase/UDP-N-acetylglucosamine-1-phosphate transferase